MPVPLCRPCAERLSRSTLLGFIAIRGMPQRLRRRQHLQKPPKSVQSFLISTESIFPAILLDRKNSGSAVLVVPALFIGDLGALPAGELFPFATGAFEPFLKGDLGALP